MLFLGQVLIANQHQFAPVRCKQRRWVAGAVSFGPIPITAAMIVGVDIRWEIGLHRDSGVTNGVKAASGQAGLLQILGCRKASRVSVIPVVTDGRSGPVKLDSDGDN